MKKVTTKVEVDLGEFCPKYKGIKIPKGIKGTIIGEDYETGGLYLQFEKPIKLPDMELPIYRFQPEQILYGIITIEVWRGCVTEVKNLPDGWDYEIVDHD